MRRKRTFSVVVTLGFVTLGLVGASIANASKPDRGPLASEPLVLAPGQGCAFDVEISSLPGSNLTQTVFSNRTVITGSGHDHVRQLPSGPSVTLHSSGNVTVSDLPNGDQRIRGSGRSIFYFFEGDQGPFGEVGADGALYYMVGRVDEILSSENFVTSFEWSGQATELCSLIDD